MGKHVRKHACKNYSYS